jgi:hypothetical protein
VRVANPEVVEVTEKAVGPVTVASPVPSTVNVASPVPRYGAKPLVIVKLCVVSGLTPVAVPLAPSAMVSVVENVGLLVSSVARLGSNKVNEVNRSTV